VSGGAIGQRVRALQRHYSNQAYRPCFLQGASEPIQGQGGSGFDFPARWSRADHLNGRQEMEAADRL
jgi:hypothetical protein